MTSAARIVKRLGVTAMAVGCAITLAGVAIAQNEGAEPSADQSGWVLGYVLVVLAIALGLVAVCRPGSRTSEIKVDEE